jgi:hypothetical protein
MVIQLSAEPTSGIATRQSLQAELRPRGAACFFTFFIFAKIVIKRKDARRLTIFNN